MTKNLLRCPCSHRFEQVGIGFLLCIRNTRLRTGSAHVFNPGAPAWGMDWCPFHTNDRSRRGYKQYLALSPFLSKSYSPIIGSRSQRPITSCIQIWSLGHTDPAGKSNEEMMKCEMVLCHDSGPAHELKWCPLPSHDTVSDSIYGERRESSSICRILRVLLKSASSVYLRAHSRTGRSRFIQSLTLRAWVHMDTTLSSQYSVRTL
jgi:hypothetical protein